MYNPNQTEQEFFQNWQAGKQAIIPYGYGLRVEQKQGDFKLVGIHHLSGAENGGNHNCYVSVLDQNGLRIDGLSIRHGYSSASFDVALDKPPNEAQGNFPMWSNVPFYWVMVIGGGDIVHGLTPVHPDEDKGNTIGHHSFHCVFVRGELAKPPVEEPQEVCEVGKIMVLVGSEWYRLVKVD